MSWIILKKRRVWVHKTKEGIVTLWPKNALMTSRGGGKKIKFLCVHSLLILELCVCEIFSSNIFLLGHKGCRLVHSIPNLLNSSVSWAYISLCAEQVPAHKQDSEEQHTNAGTYLSCPPLPASCSANMANTFLFCLCNQHRRTQCVCSVPTPFFPAQEVPVISVHTGSNAFWAPGSNALIRKLGWVLQLSTVSLRN